MALWIADAEKGLMYINSGEKRLSPQTNCLTVCGDSVICAVSDMAQRYAPNTEKLSEYSLPPGVSRLCALPGSLYCLSTEADSVSLLCPVTGRLRLCAQAGCYPRDMQLSPCGSLLLVAGGASGTALLYSAHDLTLLRQLPLPGMVYSAVFCGREIFALCAVEEDDISSHLLRISPRGVKSDVFSARGLPGALCALQDQSLLVGLIGSTVRLRPDGRVLQRYPGGLVSCIRAWPAFALTADPLSGCVQRIENSIGKSAAVIYRGASPNDMLLI
ncbi:MAG: hypothetical protein IKW00_00350 [Clostridia bacterium]|nr:hypothetical protein [Clostridia bacterium]